MKTNTVILFAALALLSAGAFADPAQQDKLLYKFLEKGIDNPFVTGQSFCHLNRVYHADYDPLANSGSQGDPLNPSISDYPPYELIFTFDKFMEEHSAHGDVVPPSFGVGGNSAALNTNGASVVDQFGNVGIDIMWIKDTCEVGDACTLDRQAFCVNEGKYPCETGSLECGEDLPVVAPGGVGGASGGGGGGGRD